MELGQIPMSPAFADSLARATDVTTASGGNEITLEHLLYALCDDPDAMAVLDASRVDIGQLKSEVAAFLSNGQPRPPPPQFGLSVSPDAVRILEAATAAARGGRRRDINGAIVLAAIVGDGRSFAAHVLQTQGLTFDEAIRALQRALAPSQLREPTISLQPTEDVLARARERVQSRAAPSLRDIQGEAPRPLPMPAAPPPAAPEPQTSGEISYDAAPPIESPRSTAHSPDAVPPDIQLAATHDAQAHSVVAHDEPTAAVAPEPIEAPAAKPVAASAAFTPVSIEAAPATINEVAAQSAVGAKSNPAEILAPSAAVPAEPPLSPYHPSQATIALPERAFPQPPFEAGFKAPVVFDFPRPAPVQPPPIPTPQRGAPAPAGTFGMDYQPLPAPLAPPGNRNQYPPPPAEFDGSQRDPSFGAPNPAAYAEPHDFGQRVAPNLDIGPSLGYPFPAPPPAQMSSPAPTLAPAPSSKARSRAVASEAGQLAENIPRAMRVGRSERVEIRIAKAAVKAVVEGLDGGGAAWRHDLVITKAMSVRMRAPDGGFFIETASPETQWIENQLGFDSDDFASWRFLVTPQSRGRARLQIVVSARTVGSDGVAAETALPDQVVDVRVRTNYKRAFARLTGWTIAALAGGALAHFGEAGLVAANIYLARFIN